MNKSILWGLALLMMTTPAWAQTGPGPGEGPTLPTEKIENDRPMPKLTEAGRRERLTFLLSGYEFFPKRADLDRVGPADEISATLRAMAGDETLRPSLRTRAVDALGYYQDAKTKAYLQGIATRELDGVRPRERRAKSAMRHHAILSLARSGGDLKTLGALLGHKDLQIRLTTYSALGKFGGDAGKAMLRKHKAGVKNPIELRELRKHVP